MALLHVLSSLRSKHDFALRAHGIDHGLRAAARAELALVADFAKSLEIPFESDRVYVAAGGNLHARARRARYEALERARTRYGFDHLVTAHHADDRAETVLIRLVSGSGVAGLAVLPARAGDRLRPMIRARRSQVVAHLDRHGVPYVEDPSNRDGRFLRTRVRYELMPLLESISPGIVGHLLALADELSESPLPAVIDEGGRPLTLRRAHKEQLRRALRHRKAGARVLIGAGRVIALDAKSGQPRLEAQNRSEPSKRPRDEED
jgi:tRNA(Ile)-lysidine synthase